jgi:general secretion pathway protein G
MTQGRVSSGDGMRIVAWCLTGVVVVFVGLALFRNSSDTREVCVAYRDLDMIYEQVELWRFSLGEYPQDLREMVVLSPDDNKSDVGFWALPRDPFGREYRLVVKDGCATLIFYGRDGVPGGDGEDRDWIWPRDRDVARSLRHRSVRRR